MYSAIVFDLDGVLIESNSSWEKLHDYFGVDEKKEKRICEDIFLKRLIMVNGYEKTYHYGKEKAFCLIKEEIETALEGLRFIDGARECIKILKENSFSLFIVSAGIDLLAQNAGRTLG